MRGCGRQHDATIAQPRSARALFHEWLRRQSARIGRFLRSPLQHRIFRKRKGRSRQLLERVVTRGFFVCGLYGLAVLASAAEPAPGTAISFLACPIARDTGPDTDLCFFAEHDGTRYALVNPPDWGVPQLKHRVLVEGHVKEGASSCGAVGIEGRAS